ncbi:Uncharacterised protein [Vibrio cholerae]|nr:Uncharacterised protein [Vibrio cholerae]
MKPKRLIVSCNPIFSLITKGHFDGLFLLSNLTTSLAELHRMLAT